MTDTLSTLFAQVDKQQNSYVARLKEVVAIDSVSSDISRRQRCFDMAEWLAKELARLGVNVRKHDLGTQKVDGTEIPLPPLVLGSYGNDPAKKTVCVYGHYDVQPANKTDGWNTEPFELVEDERGRLLGRGATDDKGPVISWLFILEAHQQLGLDFPVNLRMIFEGMEESGSEGLDEFIRNEANDANGFFKGVDCVCISDNYWLGKTKPCITYGLRGVSYFCIEVSGPGRDLHSGLFGGSVHEPMTDLALLFSRLVDPKGNILIPGIMDSVAPVTEKERDLYKGIDFNMKDFEDALGGTNTIFDNETDTLMRRWRFPSLSIHGVEGAFYGVGAKTVIPAKVIGKFSIRTVPNQDPEELTRLTVKYVEEQFKALGSKNSMKVYCIHAGRPWLSDVNHWNYAAASRALERVFGVKPDLTREGGSIPITLTFQEALGKNILLLPVGACDDGAHSINEKLDRRNFVFGIKALTAYLHEIKAAATN